MKVSEYEPLYTVIEPIRVKEPGSYFHAINIITAMRLLDYSIPKMKWDKFCRKYGDCYIYSIRDFEDTKTTSIIFGKDNMNIDPLVSVHEKDGSISWRDSNGTEN